MTTNDLMTINDAVSKMTIKQSGNAVYTARVMLGIDCNPTTASSSRMAESNSNSDNIAIVVSKIYPDPVKDIANIDYDAKTGNNLILSIFGITGNKLMEFKLDNNSLHYSFSTQQLKSGVYFYRITSDNNLISNNKFIIIK